MNWTASYWAALIEVDATKLLALISQTERAMAERSQCVPAISKQEQQAINDAACTLRILKGRTVERLSPQPG